MEGDQEKEETPKDSSFGIGIGEERGEGDSARIKRGVTPDTISYSRTARGYFLEGHVGKAEETLIKSLKETVILDDEHHHQHMIETGDNRRLIYRNNYAICKESTLPPGSSEVLFRVALDDGLLYTNSEMASKLSPFFLRKLNNEMNLVRHNLGLSWLMNPAHAQAALVSIIHSLRQFPLNPRLWLRAAEACIISSCNRGEKTLFDSIPYCYDLFAGVDMAFDPQKDIEFVRTYFATHECEDIKADMNFADTCLSNARRLLRQKHHNTTNLLPCEEMASLLELDSIYASVLTCSAFVALHHQQFQKALKCSNRVLSSDDPRVQLKLMATCYRDTALFFLGEKNWKVFRPINLNDHLLNSDTNENLSGLVSDLNAKRKYQEAIAISGDHSRISLACDRLEEYIKENMSRIPRCVISLYLYFRFRCFPSEDTVEVQHKIDTLHQMLLTVSAMYNEEYSKRINPGKRKGPINKKVTYRRNMVSSMINTKCNFHKELEFPTSSIFLHSSCTQPVLIKIGLKDDKGPGIRIPL